LFEFGDLQRTEFRNKDEDEDFICYFWSDANLEEMQLVSQENIRRLEWISEHEEDCAPDLTR
jgi:hypothetical protein